MTKETIADWFERVEAEPQIFNIPMDKEERSAHLPELFSSLIYRLRHPLPLGTRALVSKAAANHGLKRREQGYTAAMMVEESRMLQVSIFQTLQHNLGSVDFSVLLTDIMAIADEVDSQLAQAMSSYVTESNLDAKPVHA
jgi:hypothetical protein